MAKSFGRSRSFRRNQARGVSHYREDITVFTPGNIITWLLIVFCAFLFYFCKKWRNRQLVEIREKEQKDYLRWMKTDPEETLRRRLNNAKKAKLVTVLQDEHAKLSAANDEKQKTKHIEELNKKLAAIEHLNSMTEDSVSEIRSQVHKTKYGGVRPSGRPVSPVASSSRSITNHCNLP